MLAVLVLTGCASSNTDSSSESSSETEADWNAHRVDDGPSIMPVAVAVFDMDTDGDLDVVSAWRGASIGGGNELGLIAIHFQNAPTEWNTTVVDSGGRYAQVNALSVADVNQDKQPDIVCAGLDRIIYLRAPNDQDAGNQTGQWTVFEISSSIGDEFVAWFDVAVGQIDGINGLDIAAALADDGRVVWFKSPENPDSADGWQLVTIDAATRKEADSVALFDLDGDKRLDVISSAPGESTGVVSWYAQPADPVSDEWTKYPISDFAGATRFALGDLDGDQDVDIAAISPADQRAAWLIQPSQVTEPWGGFVLAKFNVGTDDRVPNDVAIADIDGDSQKDVVISTTNPGGLCWFTPRSNNQLRWTERPIVTLDNGNAALIDVGDIDQDNDIDVVAPINETTDSQDSVDWFENPLLK